MNKSLLNKLKYIHKNKKFYKYKKLSELIDNYLIPQELEKKKNAEISTPFKLRQEMLGTIDKYVPEFWKKKNRVFEPCCGKGGFLIDIVNKFLNAGLKYKEIVEECLYFSDINPTNIFICKLLIDPYNEYKLNYNEGDTLKLDIKEKWNIKGFDLVVGNPPYQEKTLGIRKGGYGGRAIWEKFVTRTFNNFVIKNGFVIYVHPAGWRKPEHKLFSEFKKRQLIYLEIHPEEDGQKIFRSSTRYDWYILQNKNKYKNTIIKDEKNMIHEVNISKYEWIPNYNFETIEKILCKNMNNACNVIYSRSIYGTDKKWVNKIKSDEFKFPIIHCMNQNGIIYVYSNIKNKKHFGIKKVILNFGRYQYPYNDFEGKYGMSQITYGIKIKSKKEGEQIVKAINSKKFKEIIKATKWSTFITDWRMFKYFKQDFWKEFI